MVRKEFSRVLIDQLRFLNELFIDFIITLSRVLLRESYMHPLMFYEIKMIILIYLSIQIYHLTKIIKISTT